MTGQTLRAGLTRDAAGNFYGTTRDGGAHGQGTVFKLVHKGTGWVLTPLYSFAGGDDGANPDSKVTLRTGRQPIWHDNRRGGRMQRQLRHGFQADTPSDGLQIAYLPWDENRDSPVHGRQ